MKINLSKETITEKIMKHNFLSFLVIFIFSFIALYIIVTLFYSFICFDLSTNIFNIGKWDEFGRIVFAVFWIYTSGAIYSFRKNLL